MGRPHEICPPLNVIILPWLGSLICARNIIQRLLNLQDEGITHACNYGKCPGRPGCGRPKPVSADVSSSCINTPAGSEGCPFLGESCESIPNKNLLQNHEIIPNRRVHLKDPIFKIKKMGFFCCFGEALSHPGTNWNIKYGISICTFRRLAQSSRSQIPIAIWMMNEGI